MFHKESDMIVKYMHMYLFMGILLLSGVSGNHNLCRSGKPS